MSIVRLLAVSPALALIACGPSTAVAPDPLQPTSTGAAFESESCSAFRPPTEPDLMGWDSGSRANLKSMREQGVIAVRYKAEGCNVELEVLNCTGEGAYEFTAYSATDSKVSTSTRDLYADLPIGAARLGSKVGGGRALRTDYMLTGIYRMPSYDAFPAAKLRGSGCSEATHVVAKLFVGGFGMASGVTESLQGGVSVFGAGAGLSQDRSTQRVAAEGNPEACERAQKDGKAEELCSVPLRVGLVPIEGRVSGSCPVGSDWDGTSCVQNKVVTTVTCPPGTKREGDGCVAVVDTKCPAGMKFQAGRGCMADVVEAPRAPVATAPASSCTSPQRTRFEAAARARGDERYAWRLVPADATLAALKAYATSARTAGAACRLEAASAALAVAVIWDDEMVGSGGVRGTNDKKTGTLALEAYDLAFSLAPEGQWSDLRRVAEGSAQWVRGDAWLSFKLVKSRYVRLRYSVDRSEANIKASNAFALSLTDEERRKATSSTLAQAAQAWLDPTR